MNTFHIEGGHALSGSIVASGNKNAALPLLALSTMLEGSLTLSNLPLIGDVLSLIQLLEGMGVRAEKRGEHGMVLDASGIRNLHMEQELAHKLRGSILLAAPLLARFGRVEFPFPGGDRIGRRRLDTHLMALEAMGATVESEPGGYVLSRKGRLQGADILLDEASVTATENTVMAAALAEGQTIIRNAACEPHVQELCHALVAAGASIAGIGTNQLTIEGVERLGEVSCEVGSDYLEVGSLIALAAVTGSEISIERVQGEHLRMILMQFQRLGIRVEVEGTTLRVPREQSLEIVPDARGAVPKIEDAPWPGFPADLISIMLVAASQAKGSILIFEKLFESRMFFVDQL
ncbi:MAG: UDP-N-acetylglucosamine 1-carboxyvinyltransferase, partial [Planctomycetota bacterium]